jgi:hypothetical protein
MSGDPRADVTAKAVWSHRWLYVAGACAIAVVAAAIAGLSGQFGKPSSAAVPPAPGPCRPGWSLTAGAIPAGDSGDSLTAIAGSSFYDLWAVGYRGPRTNQNEYPLLEHWNGRRWAYSPGAPLGGQQAELTAVSASAWNDVWAVGDFPNRSGPLIEHWNGKSWSLQQTDALARWKATADDHFVSVAALAPNNVWVLGYSASGATSPEQNLHWNGKSWHLFNGPNILSNGPNKPPTYGTQAMQILTTDRPGGVWAAGGTMVGGVGESAVPGKGVVEQWNGSQWQVDGRYEWKKPLTALAPVAPDDVWAITGGSFGNYGVDPVEVLHSNGSAWKVAMGGATSVGLDGLVATSADGAYLLGQNAHTMVIDHWDGTRWQSMPPGHVQAPSSKNGDTPSLTVTADGSIAALAPIGQNDRALYLWLRC